MLRYAGEYNERLFESMLLGQISRGVAGLSAVDQLTKLEVARDTFRTQKVEVWVVGVMEVSRTASQLLLNEKYHPKSCWRNGMQDG